MSALAADADLDTARAIFHAAPFIRHIGYRLERIAAGEAESSLRVAPEHLQHHGVVHAGVQATMLDHTCGTAAATLAPAQTSVLTVEFKVNLLRGCKGPDLRCAASVVKAGRTITLVEGKLYERLPDGREQLASTASVTIMHVTNRDA